MSKVKICDFCTSWNPNTAIKYRAMKFRWMPGVRGYRQEKIDLCDGCYREMVDYIKMKKEDRNE